MKRRDAGSHPCNTCHKTVGQGCVHSNIRTLDDYEEKGKRSP